MAIGQAATSPRATARFRRTAPAIANARIVLLLAVALAFVAGFLATDAGRAAAATTEAGPALTHLLRAMAGLKMLFAATAIALTTWRLGSPAGVPRLAAYILGCAAMSAGPGLIWHMADLKSGALLLHAGLLVTMLMLWRDPATADRLAALVARRRLMRAPG